MLRLLVWQGSHCMEALKDHYVKLRKQGLDYVRSVRTMVHLPRRAAHREWNQFEKCILQAAKPEEQSHLSSGIRQRTTEFRICSPVFWFYFLSVFPHCMFSSSISVLLRNTNVYILSHCMLEVYNFLF